MNTGKGNGNVCTTWWRGSFFMVSFTGRFACGWPESC